MVETRNSFYNKFTTIPVAAFQFWKQQNFKAMLKEIIDKSALYKFSPGEEKTQGIVDLLIEMKYQYT